MTYQIKAPHFTAGLVVEVNTVVRAAPILSYAIGRSFDWLKSYVEHRGWQIEAVNGTF